MGSGRWEVLLGPCCLRGACSLPTPSLSNQPGGSKPGLGWESVWERSREMHLGPDSSHPILGKETVEHSRYQTAPHVLLMRDKLQDLEDVSHVRMAKTRRRKIQNPERKKRMMMIMKLILTMDFWTQFSQIYRAMKELSQNLSPGLLKSLVPALVDVTTVWWEELTREGLFHLCQLWTLVATECP